jgi:hypothetical protein
MGLSLNNPDLVTSTNLPARSVALPLVKLLFLGLFSQFIYLLYIIAFPLITNTRAGGPAADLEILMRDFRWFAPIYIGGILLLYYFFWQAMQIVFQVGPGPAAGPVMVQWLGFSWDLVYSSLGPISDTLRGVSDMLTTRRGFAIASLLRMTLREVLPRGAAQALAPERLPGVAAWRAAVPCDGQSGLVKVMAQVVPCNIAETIPRTTARHIFVLFYLGLVVQLWRNKLNLISAAFLAYFGQLMLGRTFRIWYPMWLIPFAALQLTSATFWRTFLFGLTAELSIINYFVVWRWWLRDLPWDKVDLLTTTGYYWPVMHTLTVPWLFAIPLLGPIYLRRRGIGQLDGQIAPIRREA